MGLFCSFWRRFGGSEGQNGFHAYEGILDTIGGICSRSKLDCLGKTEGFELGLISEIPDRASRPGSTGASRPGSLEPGSRLASGFKFPQGDIYRRPFGSSMDPWGFCV